MCIMVIKAPSTRELSPQVTEGVIPEQALHRTGEEDPESIFC